jgi:hypothetical protein
VKTKSGRLVMYITEWVSMVMSLFIWFRVDQMVNSYQGLSSSSILLR